MLETMYAAPGIGLAAVQVNLKRLVVIDISKEEEKETYISYKSSNNTSVQKTSVYEGAAYL